MSGKSYEGKTYEELLAEVKGEMLPTTSQVHQWQEIAREALIKIGKDLKDVPVWESKLGDLLRALFAKYDGLPDVKVSEGMAPTRPKAIGLAQVKLGVAPYRYQVWATCVANRVYVHYNRMAEKSE